MSLCVTGITGLQLFWNYQNYKNTVATFKHDINAALNTAVDREMDQRQQKMVVVFKRWMADTSFVTITCNVQNRDSTTVFNMKDTHPYSKGERGISLGLTYFKEKLRHITPKAKTMFISHFGDFIVKEDLKKGIVYFYTQRLGDSLSKIYDASHINLASLNLLYKQELLAKNISTTFKLNPANNDEQHPFLTQKVNAALRRPFLKEFVIAGFESPGSYFFRQMKWLLITSLLLIGITLFCFAYTVKTLLSQHKLAKLKDDFVNNMTHELKTPVATINIAAEAIQDFNLSKDSADEYLGIIRYQAANLSTLIDQILKSVVIEQEATSINLVKTDINSLLNQLIMEYKPQSNLINAAINYKQADKNAMVMIDAPLIKNAVANLLDNALKYGGTGTQVTINHKIENNTILISIADNGPGIPLQYQDKVFERFFRIPAGNVHNVKGYGLGLSYAKSIVERHKGTLTLISKETQGTEFIISIPLIYHEASQGTIA